VLRCRSPGRPAYYPRCVSGIDWLIVAFCVALAMYGYLQGFVVGALSLVGFAIGAFIGSRIGPLLLSGGSHSQYAPLFGLLGALLAGGVLASGFEGVGIRARTAMRLPGLRAVDGVLGAVLTACVGLGIAWVVGAVALQSSNSPALRADISRSTILRGLDELLPPSGVILHALARFDPFPSVNGPPADVPPPSPAIKATPGVHAAYGSVVKILGMACGLGVEGSGWVAAPGIVVTNAHVVAGEGGTTTVEAGGVPPELRAEAIDFDVHDDVAILRVPGLRARPLAISSEAVPGTSVAILGYPEDGPLTVEPGRSGDTQIVRTQDAYGNGPVLRKIVSLRGLVRPGNSGGPLIDGAGHVAGTVFAAITGGGSPGGFAVPNSIVRSQLASAESRGTPVGTGPCGA